MTPARRFLALLLAGVIAQACGGRSRVPPCGLGATVAPGVILQRVDAGYVFSDVPRGLPSRLPARVIGERQGEVLVAHEGNRLALGYQGAGFPTDTTFAFGLLVVDDSTQRVAGVLIYGSSNVPRQRPSLGTVSGGGQPLGLWGVRVNWGELNNPRCPLLGDTTSTAAG